MLIVQQKYVQFKDVIMMIQETILLFVTLILNYILINMYIVQSILLLMTIKHVLLIMMVLLPNVMNLYVKLINVY